MAEKGMATPKQRYSMDKKKLPNGASHEKADELPGCLALFLFTGVILIFCVCIFFMLFLPFNFLYLNGRLLFVFPDLAENVEITDLIADPDGFDDTWVRVKGRIDIEKSLVYLSEVDRPGRVRLKSAVIKGASVDFYRIGGNTVHVAGEFEKEGWMTDYPFIDVVSVKERGQPGLTNILIETGFMVFGTVFMFVIVMVIKKKIIDDLMKKSNGAPG